MKFEYLGMNVQGAYNSSWTYKSCIGLKREPHQVSAGLDTSDPWRGVSSLTNKVTHSVEYELRVLTADIGSTWSANLRGDAGEIPKSTVGRLWGASGM